MLLFVLKIIGMFFFGSMVKWSVFLFILIVVLISVCFVREGRLVRIKNRVSNFIDGELMELFVLCKFYYKWEFCFRVGLNLISEVIISRED